jgi:hypothetical protein
MDRGKMEPSHAPFAAFFQKKPATVVLMGHYSEDELARMERWCESKSGYFADRNGLVFRFEHEGDAFYFRKAFGLTKDS